MYIPKKNSIFGLDIGFETIKLVQIEKRNKGHFLIGAVSIPLTERILEKDHFRNKADAANLIKNAMHKADPYNISAAKIVSALPEAFVFSKTIKLPKMSASEYEEAIPNEAAQYMPIPIEDAYFDYQILISRPDSADVDILVVASPKKLVDDYVELAKLAGLELAALETKSLAIGRAILGHNNADGIAIIHIGTEFSRISVWDNNKIRLSSTVSSGKNQLFESIGHIDGNQRDKPKITEENEENIIPIIKKITTEVTNAIKYHQTRDYKPKPVGKTILCGSGALIEGIDDLISKEIKLPVSIARHKFINHPDLGPEFTAACGLALRDELL